MADYHKTDPIYPELVLLIRLLKVASHQDVHGLNQFISDAKINWPLFIRLAIHRHRVLGQAYRLLEQFPEISLPETVFSTIKIQQQQNTLTMIKNTAELVNLLKLFSENKIKALPFKGPALGIQLYGDITTRYARDIDIVIPLNGMNRADAMLIKCGYERISPSHELSEKQLKAFIRKKNHLTFSHPQKKITVELHWHFYPDSICPTTFDDLWRNKQAIEIGGKRIWVCGNEDTLHSLLAHGVKHFWRRLFWLLDILLIVKDFSASDWDKLKKRSAQLGITRITLSTLQLLEKLFQKELPADFHKAAKKDKAIPLIVNSSVVSIITSDAHYFQTKFSLMRLKLTLSTFFLIPSIRFKAAYIAKRLSPGPKDYHRLNFSDRFFFLYYVARPLLRVYETITDLASLKRK